MFAKKWGQFCYFYPVYKYNWLRFSQPEILIAENVAKFGSLMYPKIAFQGINWLKPIDDLPETAILFNHFVQLECVYLGRASADTQNFRFLSDLIPNQGCF